MTTTNYRLPLLARLIAAHVVLFGAAAVSAAWAEDAAAGSNHSDALTPGPGQARAKGKATKAVQHWALKRVARTMRAP